MNRLLPGTFIQWQDKRWILLDIPNVDQVLLKDITNGKTVIAPASEVQLPISPARNTHGLMTISDEEWFEASQRFEAIRPLVSRTGRARTYEEIDAVAQALGKNRATIYRWIAKWEKSGTVSSLIRQGRSDVGKSRLSSTVEGIIKQQIEDFYLKRERPTVVELWECIATECRARELLVPNLSTIRRRVQRLSDRLVLSKRYSPKQARENFEPLRGSFPGADYPLAVVQIDHTPIDISLVDDTYRKPIGRGYLTIVIDSCTRMLTGFCVSLDPPGGLATGLALSHSILPKDAWLVEQDMDASWPIHGIPVKIYADNAAEFRGTMLERACREYGIVLENRPKGQPNYGGHVERLFRTFMKRTQSLPGSTFSNVEDRGEYDSDARAVMTLGEYTKWFTTFVTKVYHQRPHRGLGGIPPIKFYESFVLGGKNRQGIGLPEPIKDPYKLRLDFMPFVERTIQEYGVVIDSIHYYADVLRPWIHARDTKNPKLKRKFIFVRDPRDISQVFFLDPETKIYFPVPYRNLTHPHMSVWELNAVLKHLSNNPELQVDEDTIFKGLAEMRTIQKAAEEKSRSFRRTKQRQASWKKGVQPLIHTANVSEKDTDWETNITPFEDIEESE